MNLRRNSLLTELTYRLAGCYIFDMADMDVLIFLQLRLKNTTLLNLAFFTAISLISSMGKDNLVNSVNNVPEISPYFFHLKIIGGNYAL